MITTQQRDSAIKYLNMIKVSLIELVGIGCVANVKISSSVPASGSGDESVGSEGSSGTSSSSAEIKVDTAWYNTAKQKIYTKIEENLSNLKEEIKNNI